MKFFVFGSLALLAIVFLGQSLRGSITTVPEDNPGRAKLIDWLKTNYRALAPKPNMESN